MYYEKFAELCEKMNVRPNQVSVATGISTTTLTEWKYGKYTPKLEKLQAIADYFNVTLPVLLGGTDETEEDDLILINAYKKASPEIQLAVRKLLDIREKEDSGYSRKAE